MVWNIPIDQVGIWDNFLVRAILPFLFCRRIGISPFNASANLLLYIFPFFLMYTTFIAKVCSEGTVVLSMLQNELEDFLRFHPGCNMEKGTQREDTAEKPLFRFFSFVTFYQICRSTDMEYNGYVVQPFK
ncbi:hypothetical protein ACJX0J_036002, partial [Zea mays]